MSKFAVKQAIFYEATAQREADQKELSEIPKRQRLLLQRIKESTATQRANCPHPSWRRGTKIRHREGHGGPYEPRVPGKISTAQHASGEFEGSEHCAHCYAAFRDWKGGVVVSGPEFKDGTEEAEQRQDAEVAAHAERRQQNRAVKRANVDARDE